MNTKYIWLFVLLIGFLACDEDDKILPEEVILPELNANGLDFSSYVAVGASFSAGFTDGGLFIASQENSFPNILSKEFAKIGGGEFKQPLMADNTGGILVDGNVKRGYRLTFNSDIPGPQPLDAFLIETKGPDAFIPSIKTEAETNIGSDFNNFGIPSAKSWHLITPGYAGLNPYYTRIASTPTATVLGDAMAQSPTFFTLSEIGGNDALGYALSGGESDTMASNYNPLTDSPTFDAAFNKLVTTLTSEGAKGIVTNLPDIEYFPHFTTVPYNTLDPNDEDNGPALVAKTPTLNAIYGALNQVFAVADPSRIITFSLTEANPVVIKDENLDDLSATIAGTLGPDPNFALFIQQFGLSAEAAPVVAGFLGATYGQARQATENDLLVLPSSAIIGKVNEGVAAGLATLLPPEVAGQFSVEGITLPLADKWVLLPSEQAEIKAAISAYNATIASVINSNNNIILADFNGILEEASITGIPFDDFTMTTDLVFGGLASLDGFHLTARGYGLMAKTFLAAMDKPVEEGGFGTNFVASGNVPKANDFQTNYSPNLQ